MTQSRLHLKIGLHALGLVVLIGMGLASLVGSTVSYGQDQTCDLSKSMAEIRNCEGKKTNGEASNLKTKACSAESCIYKLSFVSHRDLGQGYDADIYQGSGYRFSTEEFKLNPPVNVDEFGARLWGPDNAVTIVGECGGSGCGGGFDYVSGPLKGADLTGPLGGPDLNSMYFVLKLPK